jgi:hypothetical protein
MQSSSFVEQQAQFARRALFQENRFPGRRTEIERFFGRNLWSRIERNEAVSWGWKDPRTTLVFPIWLHLFPDARWVHVLRNGIDVAISLHRRSLVQKRKLRNRLIALDYSPSTLDFRYSFRLWEIYVSFVLEHQHLLPSQRLLVVRYEDLLADPRTLLQSIASFASHPVEEGRLLAACQQVDQCRLDNRARASAYRNEIATLIDTPQMRELGYSYDLV